MPPSASLLGEQQVWQLIDSGLQRVGINMAFDEVLLNRVSHDFDRPILHLYGFSKKAVTVGYSQRIHGSREIEAWVKQGVEVTRRITGGGLVEHGEDLCYAFAVPLRSGLARRGHRAWLALIHEGVERAFAHLGVSLERVPADGRRHASPTHCFESPVPGDLLYQGKKIAGAAQKRARAGLLHQGSIYVGALAGKRKEFLRLFENLLRELPKAWEHTFGVRFGRRSFAMDEVKEAYSLSRTKYKDKKWIYRC